VFHRAEAEVVGVFLDGAQVVADAIGEPAVAAAWEQPSVLEEQTVGGLAGHLARGAVWAVGDYLDAGTPDGPVTFASANEYFASIIDRASEDDHRAIRERGAAVAAVGPEQLVATLDERLDTLRRVLRSIQPDALVAVVGGAVMHLKDYLETRIVEQVVHLDDLARSIGREPWPVSDDALVLTIAMGVGVSRRRHGDTAVLRALYRRGFADAAFPAL
jgi:hypothetical protein